MNIQKDSKIKKQMDRKIDRQINRQIDKIEKCVDRQTNYLYL